MSTSALIGIILAPIVGTFALTELKHYMRRPKRVEYTLEKPNDFAYYICKNAVAQGWNRPMILSDGKVDVEKSNKLMHNVWYAMLAIEDNPNLINSIAEQFTYYDTDYGDEYSMRLFEFTGKTLICDKNDINALLEDVEKNK